MSADHILVNPGVRLSPRYWEPRWGRAIQSAAQHAPQGSDALYVTSAWRPHDSGRHGTEDAIDLDVSALVNEMAGDLWAARVQQDLAWSWDVIWHRTAQGNWHLHVEDESIKDRTAWTGGQRARLALLG